MFCRELKAAASAERGLPAKPGVPTGSLGFVAASLAAALAATVAAGGVFAAGENGGGGGAGTGIMLAAA